MSTVLTMLVLSAAFFSGLAGADEGATAGARPDCCRDNPLLPLHLRDMAAQCEEDSIEHDLNLVNQCVSLAETAEQMPTCSRPYDGLVDGRLWRAFRRNFHSPCDPIPAHFLNPKSGYFPDLLKVIAPKVEFDPSERFPPTSPRDIAQTYGGSLPQYSDIPTDPVGASECAAGRFQDGRCCGTTHRPLMVDYKSAGDQEGVTSIFFTSIHRGNYDDNPGTLGADNHAYDSETAKFNFVPGPDHTMILATITFSRHEGTETLRVCDSGAYQFPTEGTHPVFLSAPGSHAMYTDPALVRPASSEVGRHRNVEARGGGLRASLLTGADSIGAADDARGITGYQGGSCIASTDPNLLQGIGSLWNDRTLGANRGGALGGRGDDLCAGNHSIRYSSRLDSSDANLKNCAH